MPRRYPLEALREVRKARTSASTEALSASMHDERRRSDEQRARAAAVAQHDARTSALADAERRALDAGSLTAEDLARGAAWALAEAERRAALAAAEREARARADEAARRTAASRVALGEAKAAEETTSRDHARWARAEEQARTAAEDEAAEEAWSARSRGMR